MVAERRRSLAPGSRRLGRRMFVCSRRSSQGPNVGCIGVDRFGQTC